MLIIHGDNQVASRDFLLASKTGRQILEFFGSNLTIDQLSQAINTRSLFGQVYTVIIESLFSQRQSTNKKSLVAFTAQNQSADIIIWEPKDVTTHLKDFDPKLIRKFDLPKYIFKFLDRPSLNSLRSVLDTASAEVVFASLVTRAYKRANTKWLAELSAIDYKLKTGNLPYDLATALELWCAKL